MKVTSTPFAAHLQAELQPVLQLDDQDVRAAVGERIVAEIHGEPVPKDPVGRPLSDREELLVQLFRHVSNINAAIEAMRMAAVFSRRFPFTKAYEANGITKVAYLRYHYEHFLQETYRVQELLLTSIQIIAKHVSSDVAPARRKEIRAPFTALRESVRAAFAGYSSQRNWIVHEARYSDDELSRIETLEFFSHGREAAPLPALKPVHDRAYRAKRKRVALEIDRVAAEVESATADVLGVLDRVVFPATGST